MNIGDIIYYFDDNEDFTIIQTSIKNMTDDVVNFCECKNVIKSWNS